MQMLNNFGDFDVSDVSRPIKKLSNNRTRSFSRLKRDGYDDLSVVSRDEEHKILSVSV